MYRQYCQLPAPEHLLKIVIPDWFFLGRDFAILTVSLEMIISCVFFILESRQIHKALKRKRVNTLVLRKETT